MAEASQRADHWDAAYESRGAAGVSWYQATPSVSLGLIEVLNVPKNGAVIDIGGGASTLVDHLVKKDFGDLTVLDISRRALEAARRRLPGDAPVTWLHEDVLSWRPQRRYDLWHDRAVLHFLIDESDRHAYLEKLGLALVSGGAVVVATFALDGPDHCSGLPVSRYSADDLTSILGEKFDIVEERREEHRTPGGTRQPFTWIAARSKSD